MARPLPCLAAACLAACLTGCPDKPNPTPAPPESAAATASAPASAMPASVTVAPSASAPPIGAPPACTIASQKVWGKGANRTTGLTASPLPDGRVAVGFAFGLTPQVLVIGRNGEGKLLKVAPAAGTAMASPPKLAEGERHLLRVTPVKVDGDKVLAFADYRDEFKNKRRRVACGPAEGNEDWIGFDGTPLLDQDPQPTGPVLSALFSKKYADGDDGYHELRDCRTFSDLRRNETWIIGSELRAAQGADGAVSNWRSSLVVDRGPTTHELHLHDLDLKGTPPHITNFEVPMLEPLHAGGYVLTARYGGTLLAALLNADKSLRGNIQLYPGYPARSDVATDGDDTIVATSMAKGKGEFLLKAMRLSGLKPELPRALSPIVTDDDNVDSESEPDFTRDSKGRRWVSYIEGIKGAGHLEIVPVDAAFHAIGKPFMITQEEDKASEGRLVELNDGTILVAFLREGEKGAMELVTEDLTCDVVK